MTLQQTPDKQAMQQLYEQVLPALAQRIHQHLRPVLPLFENFVLERWVNTWTRKPASRAAGEISLGNGNALQLGLRLQLEGFNRGGAAPFDISKELLFQLDSHGYSVGPDKESSWLEKEYLQRWEASEYELVAVKWSEDLIEDLTQRLNNLSL